MRGLKYDLECILSNYSDPVIILAGDFNSLDTTFFEQDFGLCQMVVSITHGTKIIDKVFTSHPGLYTCSTLKSIVKTKHMAVLMHPVYHQPKKQATRKKVILYDLRSNNISRLRHAIGVYNWTDLFQAHDICHVYQQFLNTIHLLLHVNVPTKTVTVGPRDPTYITPAVKALLAKRNRLRKKGHIVKANVIADKINHLIDKNRESCLSKLINATPKELWSSVNGRRKSNKSIEINGSPLNADLINTFFADIATDPDYEADKISRYRIGSDDLTYTDPAYDAIHDYQIEPLLRHLG